MEKIALTFEDIEVTNPIGELFFQRPVISMTGATPNGDYFYSSNTSSISETNPHNLKSYSGVTNMLLTGSTGNQLCA